VKERSYSAYGLRILPMEGTRQISDGDPALEFLLPGRTPRVVRMTGMNETSDKFLSLHPSSNRPLAVMMPCQHRTRAHINATDPPPQRQNNPLERNSWCRVMWRYNPSHEMHGARRASR
jgi:hypothetical protein